MLPLVMSSSADPLRPTRTLRAPLATLTRVAEPSVGFWVTKGLSTAMGEAVSDWSIRAMPPVVAVLLGFVAFAVALGLQLTRHRYLPWAYWLAVGMVGVFGTMAADVAHVVIGLPYAASFAVCAVLLGSLFLTWQRVEGTLDVHEVTTTRRELFYWAAVVLTFAMGTALGDFAAVTLHLGYAGSALLFAVLILVPAAAYRLLSWDAVACFWVAYVLTRPVGASVADWLGKPVHEGGVGVGSGPVSLVLALAMVVAVWVMTARARAVARL
ncbi:MAG: hypothetical protein ABI083_03665 [Lapillicoccus sp.]